MFNTFTDAFEVLLYNLKYRNSKEPRVQNTLNMIVNLRVPRASRKSSFIHQNITLKDILVVQNQKEADNARRIIGDKIRIDTPTTLLKYNFLINPVPQVIFFDEVNPELFSDELIYAILDKGSKIFALRSI